MSSCKLFRVYRLMFPNGKSYVGQTSKLTGERFRQHQRPDSGCVLLRHAIQKYGAETVSVQTLAITNAKTVDLTEKMFIAVHDTMMPNGYNMTVGGKERRPITDADRSHAENIRCAFWTATHSLRYPSDVMFWKNECVRRGLSRQEIDEIWFRAKMSQL